MMQPPGRIEQLNNFQDSIQSPDGLDRLRALQYIEQALPSSQGLSGMPQVTVPTPQMQPQVPMMNRAYGGEIGTGGLVGVAEDGTQIFDNSQEGALNRATHGGVLEGYNFTPSTGGTATATATTPSSTPITTNSLDAPGTLAAGGDTGASTGLRPPTSNYNYLDIPDTLYPASRGAQTTQRMPDGTIPFDLYTSKMPVTFGQGFDLKDVPYLTANRMAQDAGADRFIYHGEYAGTTDLPDDYQVGDLGVNVWRDDQFDRVNYTGTGMGVIPNPAANPNSEFAMRAKGYTRNPHTQELTYSPNNTLNARVAAARLVPTQAGVMAQYKHGGQITARAYGGEIGTGGLVDILDDGTQVFNNSQEGALNRATYGGVLEGYNFTPSTGGTATAGVTTNSLDAPGTLASGVDYSSSSGVPGIASGALADLPSVQQRQGIYNASEFKDIGMSLDRPSDAPETILGYQAPQSTLRIPTRFDSSGNPILGSEKIPQGAYVPKTIQTYGQGYDLGGLDYITANQLAFNEGADRFMYGDKFAQTDPGLLSNYDYLREGAKPYMDADFMPKNQGDFAAAGGNFTGKGMTTQSNIDNQLAKAQGYKRDFSGRLVDKFGNPVQQKAGGGQVDPSQAAQGLASFGRYGDNILVHMNPEELNGLASLGQITYNPVTGLPEAFSLKGIFKAVRKLAPIALAIAAPYAFGVAGATGLAGALKIGAATAGGSFFGNLIAGAKPKDALKAGLMSGLFAGGGAYLGGMGSAAGAGAGGGAGNVAGNVASGGTGAAGYGASLGAGAGGVSTAGTSALSAGLGIPSSMGAGGFGQAIGAGGSLTPAVAASEFTTGLAGRAITPPSVRTPLQLAQAPVNVDPNIGNIGNPIGMEARVIEAVPQNIKNYNIQKYGSQFSNQGIDNAGQMIAGPDGSYAQMQPATGDIPGASQATKVAPSLFEDSSMGNFKRIGNEIYDKYSTKEGVAKLIGMDLATPDYDIMYANEARAKEQQLRDAGYTVETDFNKQTVIRDSKGVIQPRNLTASMILDQALGKAPRTNLVARYGYGPKKEGGLIGLKHGGEFSGMVPGDGHGMEDNVYMPIVEKGHGSQVGTLAVSPSEYVVDSYTMAALGNGNADAGAKVMDNVVKRVRKKAYGDTKQPNEISGLQALKPMMERV